MSEVTLAQRHPAGVVGTIGVVGAGAMGRGIVQICLAAGGKVVLADMRSEACQEAADSVFAMLERMVVKGKLDQKQLDHARKSLTLTTLDSFTGFQDCDTVIEAIIERVDAKQSLFTGLEEVVSKSCILATNTSSLSVTEIASACAIPERVVGFHFFNPVPLMKVVEVIRGQLTCAKAAEALCRLAETFGHKPVNVIDMPGFLVNHAGRGYGTEALRLLAEGVADVTSLDRILRDQCGFRMGPFELFDLTGLDISHTVTESIYHQFYEDPRYRPSAITAQRMKANLLGRKTGRGFYQYIEGKPQIPEEPAVPPQKPCSVWICPEHELWAQELSEILSTTQAQIENGLKPSREALCFVTPLGEDATSCCSRLGLDPNRTLAIDVFSGLHKRRVAMMTPVTQAEYRDLAWALLANDGTAVSIIQDSSGFVSQRVLASIINIAAEIAQLQIATPADIDSAVCLGLGYPYGPLSWADRLGSKSVVLLLNRLFQATGDPRYRASQWLTRRALLEIPVSQPSTSV